MKMIPLCLLNTLMMVIGQILFKIGSRGKALNSVSSILKMLFSPVIILALFVYAVTTVLWLFILSKVDISFAYPIQALAFPIVLIVSAWIFHEIIPLNRWVGVVIIFIGICVAIYK